MEAMYYGVAMLGFPQMFEQWNVAYRLLKLGNARIMRQGVTAEFMYE